MISTFMLLAVFLVPKATFQIMEAAPWLGNEVKRPLWLMILMPLSVVHFAIYGFFIYKTPPGRWMRDQGNELFYKLGIKSNNCDKTD
jgi:hypothetical protein